MTEVVNKILINVEDDETRIALLNGNHLENLYIEQTDRTQKVGNIYCGKVVKIQPSFQAAFIDFGEDRHGFLSISDINFQVYRPKNEGRGRSSISNILKVGQKILVQVIKDEIAHKGASLSTNISIAGRFLVFMPDSDRGGVSKKIEDEEQRNRLRHLLKGLGSENSSAIIRTVGVDRSLTELKRDYTILRKTWVDIKNNYESESKPKLLFKEEDAMVKMIRDYYNDSIDEVIIDEPVAFQHVIKFFQTNLPTEQRKLKLYLGETSLFQNHSVESQIEILENKEVPLPSGGSIIIMPTEALVAIDVNSGKSTQEKNVEDTALRTNIEAAEEISRQLRLRNLGGLIVIDFIDMENSKNRLLVEKKLEESMILDKAKTSFGMISKFGLLELSRQRISSSLSNNSYLITLANRIIRKINDTANLEKLLEVRLILPITLSSYIQNNKRQILAQMEMDNGIRIIISPDIKLKEKEIPDMEIMINDQENVEIQKKISISALKVSDEKNILKKDNNKNLNKKDLIADSDSQNIDPDGEKNIAQDFVKSSKQIPKRVNSVKDKEKNKKQKTADSPNNENGDSNKSSKKDIQKNNDAGNKLKNISKNLNKEKSVTLFESTHEPLDEQKVKNKLKSEANGSFLNKADSNFSHKSNHFKIKEKIEQNQNPSEKKGIEPFSKDTPIYASVHLNEKKSTKISKKSLNVSKNSRKKETSLLRNNVDISSQSNTKSKESISKKDLSKLTKGNSKKIEKTKIEIKSKEKTIPVKKKAADKNENLEKNYNSKSLNRENKKRNTSKSLTKDSKLTKQKTDSTKISRKNLKEKNSAK